MVVYKKGHKNSKGEKAEWCIVSHKTHKILSSHKSKSAAKAHLQQMHIFKEAQDTIDMLVNDFKINALLEQMDNWEVKSMGYEKYLSIQVNPNLELYISVNWDGKGDEYFTVGNENVSDESFACRTVADVAEKLEQYLDAQGSLTESVMSLDEAFTVLNENGYITEATSFDDIFAEFVDCMREICTMNHLNVVPFKRTNENGEKVDGFKVESFRSDYDREDAPTEYLYAEVFDLYNDGKIYIKWTVDHENFYTMKCPTNTLYKGARLLFKNIAV